MRKRWGIWGALAVAAALLVPVVAVKAAPGGSQAGSSSAPFVNLPALLPPLPVPGGADTAPECRSGAPSCVDATIAEMDGRFQALAEACDHDAVFALSYLRTTQTYKAARDRPGYFADTAWVNHEDAVFAAYYFRPFDRYHSGRSVPPAWRTAFDAARRRQVTAYGNLLLGINAHVTRDLPFVLASIGLRQLDGTSRKPDHDKVNQFLNAELAALLDEIGARFDPNVRSFGAANTALFQLLAGWRELAWRNAELLVAAPNAQARALVASEIEAASALQALGIATANSYVPGLRGAASRDAFCAAHHDDPPPTPYPFGPAGP